MKKDYSIGSIDYSQGNDFDFSYQIEQKTCHFCTGINLNRCMTISVFNKHNEQVNFYSKLIDVLVQKVHSPSYIKYEELLKKIDDQQKIKKYYPKSRYNLEIKQLLEYYKYRKFVPLFGDLRLGKILNSYYYIRLKLYYNQIKKKLNLTIQPSSDTQYSQDESLSVSRQFMKQNVLNDLTYVIQGNTNANLNDHQTSNLQNYKTQSKALQDLVNFLKSNEKFKFIRPLNVQTQWQKQKISSKQMFKDTILQKNKEKQKGLNKGKSKIFITFYSRDSPLVRNKKSTLKILNSERLAKSKDLKRINKEKQHKIVQKNQKMKEEIIDSKLLPFPPNKQSLRKTQQISNQYNSSTKNKIFKQQPSRNFLKIKQNIQHNSAKKTPSKININQIDKKTKDYIKKLGNEKLIIGNMNQNKNSPYNQKSNQIIHKQRRSQSQAKLTKKTNIPQRSKSIKALTNKQIQTFINGKKLFLDNNQSTNNTKLKSNKQDTKILPKRRKSLDLTKMKTNFIQGMQNKIQFMKKQQFLTQRYTKIILQQQKPSIQIRTTNVSPVNKKKQRDNLDQIVFQKSDNITSIKKKKLQLLKKKIQIQKMQKK